MRLFEEEEYEALVLGYVEGAGARGATEEEITQFVRWCEEIAAARTMIGMVIEGTVNPFYNEQIGDYVFTRKGSVN